MPEQPLPPADRPPTIYTDQSVPFDWSAPAKQSAIIRANLFYDGTETPRSDGRGLPLLAIFVGVVLLPHLARALLAIQKEIRTGGVIVDTRGETMRVSHDKALDGGVILIVGSDGTKIVERSAAIDPASLIAMLAKSVAT